jgi:hypothetical protein
MKAGQAIPLLIPSNEQLATLLADTLSRRSRLVIVIFRLALPANCLAAAGIRTINSPPL